MLTDVQVFTEGVTAPSFPATDGNPANDPIQIRNIDGLGPVAATINTQQYGSVAGESYSGSTLPSRNIVMTFGLNPNWVDQTIESLRMLLYQYFMTGQGVRLVIDSTHRPKVQISGYVESMDPSIFSKDPEIQVSIVCPQPYFVAVSNSAITGLTSGLSSGNSTDINYEGDAPVGYTLDIVKQGTPVVTNGEFRVINKTISTQIFSVTTTVDASHFLRISTVQGNKFAQQLPLPSGSGTDLIGKVVPGSFWSPLQKGVNKLQVLSATANLGWTLKYNALYGGL